MDKRSVQHWTSYGVENEHCLFSWTIRRDGSSDRNNVVCEEFETESGFKCDAILHESEDEFTFTIRSSPHLLKGNCTMFLGSESSLTRDFEEPTFTCEGVPMPNIYKIELSSEHTTFRQLQENRNSTLTVMWRITLIASTLGTSATHHARTLAAAFRSFPEQNSREKVLLEVGEETLPVSKIVLCARSPVFARMFEIDMEERRSNKVTMTDVEMPVVRAMVAFMYSGTLCLDGIVGEQSDASTSEPPAKRAREDDPMKSTGLKNSSNGDVEFLMKIFNLADKYDMPELRHACTNLIVAGISYENIFDVLKFAFTRNDVWLKSTVMTLIVENIEQLIVSNEWKTLLDEEPEIASEVLNFL